MHGQLHAASTAPIPTLYVCPPPHLLQSLDLPLSITHYFQETNTVIARLWVHNILYTAIVYQPISGLLDAITTLALKSRVICPRLASCAGYHAGYRLACIIYYITAA